MWNSASCSIDIKQASRLFNVDESEEAEVKQEQRYLVEVLVAEQHPRQGAASSQAHSWNPVKLDKD